MDISIDPDEVSEALRLALLNDPDLLAEVDELFFGEQSTYETRGLLNYVFTVGATAADGTNGQCLAVRQRDKNERRAVLLAAEENGLVRRRSHGQNTSTRGWVCQV